MSFIAFFDLQSQQKQSWGGASFISTKNFFE